MYIFVSRIYIKKFFVRQRFLTSSFKMIFNTKNNTALKKHKLKRRQGYIWMMEVWETKQDMLRYHLSNNHIHFMNDAEEVVNLEFEHPGVPKWPEVIARFEEQEQAG